MDVSLFKLPPIEPRFLSQAVKACAGNLGSPVQSLGLAKLIIITFTLPWSNKLAANKGWFLPE